jgi:serine/threonine protein kinase
VIAGRYTLEAEIGRGGMGAVWRGLDEVLRRPVALKKIGVAPGGITADARRAEREAKLAAKLNHVNVVAVFDLVEETTDGQNQQWLVMEYVDGTDLAEVIRQRGRLTPDDAAPILAQVAAALAAAHGAGIVHRDVKPSNILVAPNGQVKLSDFGIARTAADPSLTQTGLVTGSPAYLSPEVASGQQATPASDVWSWGATLFHALEGRPPYQVGDNLLGALYRIVHEDPPPCPEAGWLAPALAATMTRDAYQRWPIARVQEFLESGRDTTPPDTPPDTQPATEPVAAGGLADLGLVGADPAEAGRTRSYDDQGTQVLPLTTTTAPRPVAPTGPPPVPGGPGWRDSAPRRRWWVVAAAVLALVAAMAVAFALGLHDRGGDDPEESSSGPGPRPSASASEQPDKPTEVGMVDFIETYIATASSDPESAFDMLTPSFQDASKGLSGYLGFWGDVRDAKVLEVSADPATLEVRYTYRYTKPPGPPVEDDVVLRLTYEDGTYLIDQEV